MPPSCCSALVTCTAKASPAFIVAASTPDELLSDETE